jgi:hypothetical protein
MFGIRHQRWPTYADMKNTRLAPGGIAGDIAELAVVGLGLRPAPHAIQACHQYLVRAVAFILLRHPRHASYAYSVRQSFAANSFLLASHLTRDNDLQHVHMLYSEVLR